MSNTVVQTIRKRGLMPVQEDIIPIIRKRRRKRIPIAEIYWKKGDYAELVDDPFNLN